MCSPRTGGVKKMGTNAAQGRAKKKKKVGPGGVRKRGPPGWKNGKPYKEEET